MDDFIRYSSRYKAFPAKFIEFFSQNGTGQIRTGDLALRRRSLYPAELQPQMDIT